MKKILYALILMLIVYSPSTAQTVEDTVGNGTATGLYYGLIYRYSATSTSYYSKNVLLYTQAELAAENILPGNTITAIAFHKANNTILTNGATAVLTIAMKDGGTAGSFTSAGANIHTYTAAATFTNVATINMNSTTNNFAPTPGWIYFTFSTPFTYTGGDLEIFGDWALTPGTGAASDGAINWTSHTGATNKTLMGFGGTPGGGSTYVYSTRGNTIFVHTSSTAPTTCTGTPAHATITGPPSAICANTSTTLSAAGFATGAGISYKWQVSPPAVNTWTDYPGAITTSITPTLPSSVDFRMVTMCSGSGLADTSNVITVNVTPLPVAGSITEVHAGLSYTFTAVGVQNATSDVWLYGDGNSGTSTTHIYATGGTYTVRHAVANACGNDTATLVITAAPPLCSGTPDPVTITGPANACENAVFNVTASGQSTGNGISYQWQFQVVGSSGFIDVPAPGGQANPLSFVSPADVELRFITTCSGSGLSDTSNVLLVDIDSLPDAGNITRTIAGSTVTFTANGVQHAASQIWHYGDGISDATGVHTYTSGGSYNVMFIATNPCGSDTAYNLVTLGIEDVDNLADFITLYPNPASDHIQVKTLGNISFNAITVVSATGSVVLKEDMDPAKTHTLSIARLAAGTYILRIHTPGGVINKQFSVIR